MAKRDSPAGKKLAFSVVAILVPCLLLFLLAEGAVRLRAKLKYGFVWGVGEIFAVDQKLDLRVLVPGAELGGIKINSLGFRGPELVSPKPAGTIRVGFLGASTTFCAEVTPNERTWPHLVVQRLSEEFPSARFDYINAGVPGYSVGSSLRLLTARVARLEPDVLVVYHGTNDLSGNSFDMARSQGIVEKRTEKDQLWLSRHSLLVHLAEKNLRIMFTPVEATATTRKASFDADGLAMPFQRDLRSLVEAAKSSASLVALATFSARIREEQSDGEKKRSAVTSLYYMPYMTLDSLIAGFDLYNEVIRDVADRENVLLIGGEDDIPGDGFHFNDSVHFTDAGSEMMATRVSTGLLASARFRSVVQDVTALRVNPSHLNLAVH